jgi:hypothetical protein
MRKLILAFVTSLVVAGCSNSTNGDSGPAIVSCVWGAGTCDQYGGTLDANFAANLETICIEHGVAFAAAACPAASQVPGHCDLGTTGGMTSWYFYYSPTYDATSAQADCEGSVVGVTWVP